METHAEPAPGTPTAIVLHLDPDGEVRLPGRVVSVDAGIGFSLRFDLAEPAVRDALARFLQRGIGA